jgi:adenosine deaminase
MPKIELHAHIGGCLRAETFLEMAEDRGISVDHIDFYNVDIKGAFEIFKVVGLIMTDLDSLERVVREIIEDYAKQNCIYLELRSTPKALLIDRLTGTKGIMQDYIDRVLKAIKEGEQAENG